MTKAEFLSMLAQEDFPAPVLVTREANGFLDTHSHPFEVKALVIQGQINITINDIKHCHVTGYLFHLLNNQVHTESYGIQGVEYLASRKD